MRAFARPRNGSLVTGIWFCVAGLAAAFAVGVRGLPLSGGSFGIAIALLLVLAPLAVYGTITRPLMMPFAIWAALVPLDEVIAVRGGSLERLLGALAAGAVVVYMLLRRPTFAPPRPAGAWFAFCVFAMVSLMWVNDVPRGVSLLVTLVGLLAVVALVAMVRCERTDLSWIFGAVMAGSVATAFYTIWIMLHTHLSGQIQRVFFGTHDLKVDPNRLAASLVFPAIIALVAAASLRNRNARIACGAAAAITCVGVFVAESRGAMIALGIGFAYAFLRSRVKWAYAPLGVAMIAMVAVRPEILERFTDPHFAHGSGRTDIWRVGFAAFKEHWLLGSGFGSFRDAYQAAYLNVYQSAAFRTPIQDAHNLIVYVGVESGIVGLALLAWAIVAQFRLLRRIDVHSGGWYDARVAMEAATIAVFLNALSVDLIVSKALWLLLGASWVLSAAYRTAQQTAGRTFVSPDGEASAGSHRL